MEQIKMEVFKVEYDASKTKATLVCIDRTTNEMLEPTLSKGRYNETTDKYELDANKAEFIEGFCKETFKLSFDELEKLVGKEVEIFVYDTFASLYETAVIPKSDPVPEELFGKIKKGTIKEIYGDDKGYAVYIDYEGKTFKANFMWAKYIEELGEWLIQKTNKPKKIKKFEDTFGVHPDKADTLIGQEYMFEVKKAFGKFLYIEIKGN